MKSIISQQQLAHGLSLVTRAVSPRSTLPVLGNVLVATDEGRIRLSATNLELGISCWIGAKIEEEGAITVPARTFADLVSTLPSAEVTLTVNTRTQTLNILCGGSITDIKGIDAQEFPPMPVTDLSNSVSLNVSDFKEMVQQVAFAASTDEARPVLQGVSLNLGDGKITLAATDGFRVSVRSAPLSVESGQSLTAIIPARALTELARIAVDGEDAIQMVILPGRGQVLFHLRDAELISQLIEGNFPDYKMIIPRGFKTRTVISTAGFLKACKQAEIIARDGNNVIRMSMTPGEESPGIIKISALSEETGSSDIELEGNIEGPSIVIAFNVGFLREVLEVIKTPSVILETNANNTPGMLTPIGGENFTHVIMPMHLG